MQLPSVPLRVLEAPGVPDDFYTEALAWSNRDVLAVGLRSGIFLYRPTPGTCQRLRGDTAGEATSVAWSPCGSRLSVGGRGGSLRVWDLGLEQSIVHTAPRLHSGRISTASWNSPFVVSTAGKDCAISHVDLRCNKGSRPESFRGHSGEVCGIRWNAAQPLLLLSGGDDNKVCVWDWRVPNEPLWSISSFTGAVKALDWSPNNSDLFATGGGSMDRRLGIWCSRAQKRIDIRDTGSQICGLRWTALLNEIVSVHGFVDNDVGVWAVSPKGLVRGRVGTWKGHSMRVLHVAVSPDAGVVGTLSGDETLRMWRLGAGNVRGKEREKEKGGLCDLR